MKMPAAATVTATSSYYQRNIITDPSFRLQRSVYSIIKHYLEEPCVEKTRGVSASAQFCPIVSLFPCLLAFLQDILSEGANVMLESNLVKDGGLSARNYCQSCGINMELRRMAERRRKRVTCADIALLHGEIEDDDKNRNKYKPSRNTRNMGRPNPRKLTLKSVIDGKDTNDLTRIDTAPCPNCEHVAAPPSDQTYDPSEATITAWCRIRDRVIHSMISSFQFAKFLPQRRPYDLLQSAIAISCNSTSLRLCCLQLAHILGDRGYQYLLDSLWERATEKDANYLTWYAEVVAFSCFCDDRDRCWAALQPLLNRSRLLGAAESKSNPFNRFNCDKQIPRVLGYILRHRWSLLQSLGDDNISRDLSLFVAEISWSFDASDWMNPLDGVDPDSEMLDTFDAEGKKEVGMDRNKADEQAPLFSLNQEVLYQVYKQIIFSPKEIAGLADHQISSLVFYEFNKCLLSARNNQKHVPPQRTDAESVVRKESVTCIPLLDNDVLKNVFTFLGYKRLVKIRSVCSSWKQMADEDHFWLPLFKKRFGLMGYKKESILARATTEVTPSLWKRRFVNKLWVERQVRFKVNKKKNFKHVVCKHFDCYHVLTTPERLARHMKMHEREAERTAKKKTGKGLGRTSYDTTSKSGDPAIGSRKKTKTLCDHSKTKRNPREPVLCNG